jgi:hypothetical protein
VAYFYFFVQNWVKPKGREAVKNYFFKGSALLLEKGM